MKCTKIKETASLLIDGQLDRITEEEVLTHMENCEDCALYYRALKDMVTEVGYLPMIELPENFHGEWMQKIETIKPQKMFGVKRWVYMAAASFVVLFGISYMLFGKGGHFKSPSEEKGAPAPQVVSYQYAAGQLNDGFAEEEVAQQDWAMAEIEEESAMEARIPLDSQYEDRENVETEKIVKIMDISLEVQDFDAAVQAVKALAQNAGGYVQNYERTVYQKDMESGFMRLRIPVAVYENFSVSVLSIGSVVSQYENAEDITEEYEDIQSRLATKKVEEERLLAILVDTVTREDILTLEERLSYVRNEIEMMEAQIKNFDKRVSYSIVNVSFS